MKTPKSVVVSIVLSTTLVSVTSFAHADELKSAMVPVEAAYCRGKLAAMDASLDLSMTLGPSFGQRMIDVYEFCNDDPLRMDESSSYIRSTSVNVFETAE